MALSNTFIAIFDKAISNGHARECENKWVVVENGKDATLTHLEVNALGDFLGFDHDLVKGVKDTTTKMSSNLEDKDCDGIAFLNDNSKQEHLVFAELKSNFDVQKITGAFHQITMSFIKMHAWLSLCKDYNLDKIKVHFITACKCCKDRDQEDNVRLRKGSLHVSTVDRESFGFANFCYDFLKETRNQWNLSFYTYPFLGIIHNRITASQASATAG